MVQSSNCKILCNYFFEPVNSKVLLDFTMAYEELHFSSSAVIQNPHFTKQLQIPD